jgi:hypothetical protein
MFALLSSLLSLFSFSTVHTAAAPVTTTTCQVVYADAPSPCAANQ